MTKILTTLLAISTFTLCTSCTKEEKSTEPAAGAFSKDQSFEALLTSIDKKIGRRTSATQMNEVQMASYEYDGPLDEITKLVTSYAEANNYKQISSDLKESLRSMDVDSDVKPEFLKLIEKDFSFKESKMFQHDDGRMLSMVRIKMNMNISGEEDDDEEMSILTLQLMDYDRAPKE